jgi:hypothetical protein
MYMPLGSRYIVFSVPIRRKIPGSGLYKGNPKRYAFNRAEEIWILASGVECHEQLKPGTHCWLNDAFELEPTDLNLWDKFKDDPNFKRLKDFVDSVDGDVKTSIVSEVSLLAVDDDYEAEEINHHFVR